MALMTYSRLTGTRGAEGSIRTWINKDVPAEEVLDDAQAYIYRRLRIREMVTATTGTMSASQTAIDLPSRYVQTVRLQFTTPDAYDGERHDLGAVDGARVYDSAGALTTGVPQAYAVAGSEIVFPVACDTARTWFHRYYQRLPALSTDTETNALTERAPRLLRAACLAYANEYMKDEAEANRWLEIAENEIAQLNVEADLEGNNPNTHRDVNA